MLGGLLQDAQLLLRGLLHRRGGAGLCFQREDVQEQVHHGAGNGDDDINDHNDDSDDGDDDDE